MINLNMKTLFLSFLFLCGGVAMAQNYDAVVPPPPSDEPQVDGGTQVQPVPVYQFVEQMPQFPGGDQAMMEYLKKNLRYPTVARENGVEGRVIVRFVVNEDGKVSDVVIMRDIGSGCGQEAVRVVSMMPKWIPGKQNGRAVKTFFTLPVTFRLT
jgi:protein TonB